MSEKSPLFRLEQDSARAPQHAPVMVVALEGFLDAGHVRSQLADHVLSTLEHEVVATFDVDALVDYRGRRPTMTFERDRWVDYDEPSLQLYRVRDADGDPFLLLHGVEPDYRWEGFAEAVHQLCLGFGVRTMVSGHGIPMAVPHTRPIGMTRFSSEPERLSRSEPVFGQVQVPGSAESLLHLRLGQAGVTTMGAAVHVPHYLSESVFVEAGVAALGALTDFTGLTVPTEDLVAAAALNRAEIAAEISGSPEAREVVEALEQRYDRFLEGQQRRSLLAAEVAELPSADEIGAELERFLRDQGDEGGPEQAKGPAQP